MSYSQKITLEWHGPFTFRTLLTDLSCLDQFSKPGVYLWVERKENRLYYVGRSLDNLVKRHREHNAKFVGGLYNIPPEYRSNGVEWVPDLRRPEVLSTLFSVDKHIDLVKDAHAYRDNIDVYLSVKELSDKILIKSVERNLIYDLQPAGTEPGKHSLPTQRLNIAHRSAAWIEAVSGDLKQSIEYA